jgi:putative ABC transport system ATP-binding protein
VLGLSQLLLGPLQSIAQAVPSVRRGRASAARIDVLLGAADGTPRAPASETTGSMVVGGTINVASGSIHGVVCNSAAEAEVLHRSLSGEGRQGQIGVSIDGAAITELDPTRVLVWPHKGVPLGATVGEMVGVAAHGRDVAERAIMAASATEILERTADGWDAPVAESGSSLSGGERQRLALARALSESPEVLVLNEPTSAVDAVTEMEIAAGIKRMRSGKTTVLVTSSPTLLASCDQVTLVIDSRVARSGVHRELLADPDYLRVVAR